MVKIERNPAKTAAKKKMIRDIRAKPKIGGLKSKVKSKTKPLKTEGNSPKKPKRAMKLSKIKKESEMRSEGENYSDEENKNDRDIENSSEDEDVAVQESKFKQSLANLQETDAEFYNFLKENDKKLLNFNFSDGDSDQESIEELHKPEGELEVASDESDFEDETSETKRDDRVVTLKMLKEWQRDIGADKSNKTITALIKAFHAAVLRVSSDNGDQDEAVSYKVEGSGVFNAVIQICVLELGPAVRRYLKIAPGSKQPPHKCKKFVKIKALLRGYFADLLKILKGVTSPNILTVLLKHIHYMAPILFSYGNVAKSMLKKLTELWSTSDENVRVVAFLCILRITNSHPQALLDLVLKTMHLAYVRNSKFVSANTLPGINFMRRSLVEMFALDVNVSHQHVFLNIRQLAIHLRNAITVRKKENTQIVYNWQFVNSLRLWGSLLSTTYGKAQLKPMVYPFVQVCLGTLKLVPTAQYYPLRFHITQILMDLSSNTGVFIPILPFIIEILTVYDFNKKHQKVSMKPLDFTCILRLSKSQLSENGFKDSLIDTIYSQLLEYLSTNSSSLAFPDLTLFPTIQLKQFVKTCSVASYCRKMKQILDKIEENRRFIEKERKNVQFNLSDFKQIDAWETTVRNKGTPLGRYYEAWNKMRTIKKNKEATRNDALGEYALPTLKKSAKAGNKPPKDPEGKVELFPSDSEDEEKEIKVGKKRGKRGSKSGAKKRRSLPQDTEENEDFQEDIVEDIKISDW